MFPTCKLATLAAFCCLYGIAVAAPMNRESHRSSDGSSFSGIRTSSSSGHEFSRDDFSLSNQRGDPLEERGSRIARHPTSGQRFRSGYPSGYGPYDSSYPEQHTYDYEGASSGHGMHRDNDPYNPQQSYHDYSRYYSRHDPRSEEQHGSSMTGYLDMGTYGHTSFEEHLGESPMEAERRQKHERKLQKARDLIETYERAQRDRRLRRDNKISYEAYQKARSLVDGTGP
ncbi:hypothetical protein CBS101457_000163 [Exobasidium rhododendri]|nr:hypothetical protein CBS101457_000163 [Exobasidium rhododendri]